jgi:hypothetical protein
MVPRFDTNLEGAAPPAPKLTFAALEAACAINAQDG